MNFIGEPHTEPLNREEAVAMLDTIREILRKDPSYEGISDGLRKRLHQTFREDVERLVADGFLAPRNWTNFPEDGLHTP